MELLKMDINDIDINIKAFFNTDGEYDHSEVYISHDNGQDKELYRRFEDVKELQESLGGILAEYMDSKL